MTFYVYSSQFIPEPTYCMLGENSSASLALVVISDITCPAESKGPTVWHTRFLIH